MVAATHRDLREEVNNDRFRAEPLLSIGGDRRSMPPLRERVEDIAAISEMILGNLGVDDETLRSLSEPSFVSQLSAPSWPGNARELRNHLERCVVFGQVVPVHPGAGEQADQPPRVDPNEPFHGAKRAWVERFERAYVEALLTAHNGKVTKAAEAAGIGRVLLWKLCNKYKLGKYSIVACPLGGVRCLSRSRTPIECFVCLRVCSRVLSY